MALSDWREVADIVFRGASVIAMIVGGMWTYKLYVKQRIHFPKVEVTHKLRCVKLTQNHIYLSLDILVKNIGACLTELEECEARLHKVLPAGEAFLAKAKSLDVQGEHRLPWPEIASKTIEWKKGECEIEPGERDVFYMDFLIPTEIKVFMVYLYIKNVKKKNKEVGWTNTSTYRMVDVLKGAVNESENCSGKSKRA